MDIEILDWTSDLDRPSAIDALDTADLPVCHTVSVTERRIAIDDRTLIQNNVRTDTLALNLDGEWDGANVVVLIGKTGSEVELEWAGEPVVIPAQVAESVGAIDVSVVGYSSDGTVRLVTAEASGAMTVIRSGALTGEVPAEEAPDVLAQLLESATDARRAATEADEAAATANAAADRVDGAIDTATSAASQATSAAASATTATAKATEAANTANAVISQLPLPDGNVPRATKRGEVVSVDDAFAATPLGLKVYGKTRQNLWQNPSGMSAGITVTANDDGSVTVSGTSAGNSSVVSGSIYALKPGGTYTLSIDSETDFSTYGFFIQSYDGSSYTTLGRVFGATKSAMVTVPSSSVSCRMGVQIAVTTPVSGTYKVMLNEGSTAEPWCPPGIHGVGELMAHERNLWVNYSGENSGVSITSNGDGSMTISGTASSLVTANKYVDYFKPGTAYSAKVYGDISDATVKIAFNNLPATGYKEVAVTSSGVTFETPSSVENAALQVIVQSGATAQGTFRVMLNEGDTASPWVPPQVESCVVLRTGGKNLVPKLQSNTSMGLTFSVNENGSVRVSGTTTGQYAASYVAALNLKPGTYCIKKSGVSNVPCQVSLVRDGATKYFDASMNDTEMTIKDGDEKIQFRIVSNYLAGNSVNSTIYPQIELGSTATAYEPPMTPTLTPVDLKGEVLYDLPDGTEDELVIDSTGAASVVKRVPMKDLGSISAVSTSQKEGSLRNFTYYKEFTDRKKEPFTGSQLVCDRLPVVAHNNTQVVTEPCVSFHTDDTFYNYLYVWPPASLGLETVEQLDEWTEANPTNIFYSLENPVVKSLDSVPLPTLAAPNATLWDAGTHLGEVEMEYIRDINVVLSKLEGAM